MRETKYPVFGISVKTMSSVIPRKPVTEASVKMLGISVDTSATVVNVCSTLASTGVLSDTSVCSMRGEVTLPLIPACCSKIKIYRITTGCGIWLR